MQKIPISYINGLKGAYYALATGTGASQNITIPAGYLASDLLVFEDGVLQLAGTHYTVSGTTLTGTFALGAQLIITSPGGSQGAKGDTGAAGNMSGSNNLSEITNPAVARGYLQIVNASAAEYRAGTSNRYLLTDSVYSAATPVVITDAATITIDFSTLINGTLTLAGNRTLANPTNMKIGQSGFLTLIQDATGSRTLTFGDQWWFSGGVAPTLSTAASTVDRLYYTVTSSTSIDCSLVKNMSKTYDPDAQAYFSAHNNQASTARKQLINDLVVGLKADGVWNLFDNLWLLASHDQQSSLVNLVRPSKSLLLYNYNGGPFFTTDKGWAQSNPQGNISVNQLYTPDIMYGTTSGVSTKRTSAAVGAFGVWENTTTINSGYGIIGDKSNNNYDTIYQNGSTLYGQMGGGGYITANIGTTTGLKALARAGSNNLRLIFNGSNVATGSAGNAVQSAQMGILGYGSNGNYNGTPNRSAMAFSGGDGFTAAIMTAFYNRMNTYLTAIGAN